MTGRTYPTTEVAVTGAGIAVPGLAEVADLLAATAPPAGFDPSTGLKGREMRNKDRASRLALRAVGPALRDSGLAEGDDYTGPVAGTAVVVSTNYGNLDSVCGFTDVIADETVTSLSPLGLPHTSSNVIAGWVAIRYRMRGPNLTVCNGPTSGIDALYWARNLVAAGRAEVVVVVGVEPDTEPVARLVAGESAEQGTPRLLDGAAAVVIETLARARSRGRRTLATLVGCARAADLPTAVALARQGDGARVGLLLAAERTNGAALGSPAATAIGDTTADGTATGAAAVIDAARWLDLTRRLGHCSGALGVLQCAAGAAYLAGSGAGSVLAVAGGGPDDDGAAAMVLTGPGEAA